MYSSLFPIIYSSSVIVFNVHNQEIDMNHDLCNYM